MGLNEQYATTICKSKQEYNMTLSLWELLHIPHQPKNVL